MKSIFIKALFFLLFVSCSTDLTDESSTDKKRLTQIVYEYFDQDFKAVKNIEYDALGRVVLITDEEGKTLETYLYNSIGKLHKKEFFDFNSETNVLRNKEVTEYTYNSDDKISGVTEIYSYYDTEGNFISDSSVYNEVTYSNNIMVRLNTNYNYKTEYGFDENNLITSIKVFKDDILKSNMTFSYDAEGNCIAGSGPIDEGSLDSTTDNINLKVIYDIEEKNAFFNQFFEYEILSSGQGFYNLKQILIDQQGNKYAKEIEWYQYQGNIYKETKDNVFDVNKYITTSSLSEMPNYLNYGNITYVWE